MATINKSKSQTYNFLLENKSIEDIKNQENIKVKEIKNKRHSGKTYRIINSNNKQLNDEQVIKDALNNLEIVATSLTDNEKEQVINNDIWTKFKNYLNWPTSNTEELIQSQKKYIEQLEQSHLEKDKEIQQLKKENEKSKQSNNNFDKFKYNVITIYDEKQSKKTGIKKIHEEILPINNKIYFITTIQKIDNSINEEIIHFYQDNNEIEVMMQLKQYENINKYKDDLFLIEENSNHKKNIKIEALSIKEFLNQQTLEKLKPTKTEKWIWIISVILPTIAIIIGIFHPPALIVGGIGLAFKTCTSIFSSATRKVDAWFGNKFYKSKEQKEKEKNERESIIKNLTSDKLDIKIETQFNLLKQKLDNRKEKNPDKLISSNKTINHNSNSIWENSSIESENNQNFDSSIKNTVNHQNSQPSTSSIKNWNKVKCLLTT